MISIGTHPIEDNYKMDFRRERSTTDKIQSFLDYCKV